MRFISHTDLLVCNVNKFSFFLNENVLAEKKLSPEYNFAEYSWNSVMIQKPCNEVIIENIDR